MGWRAAQYTVRAACTPDPGVASSRDRLLLAVLPAMSRMCEPMRTALLFLALAAALPAAADGGAAPENDNFFKRLGRQIANDAKGGAKQAGKAYGDLGRSVGHGTVNTGKKVGSEIKDSSKRTVKAAKDTF